jgi:carboxymethylenebutenolidase
MSGEMVQFSSNGEKCEGYLATPPGKGPGVIVIQEWWGLVDHIKEVCDRFAAAGYVALAPDMYHGKSTTSPDEAGKLMMALSIDRAEKDLRGAVRFLLTHDATEGNSVGTIGFCMGGALSLYAASKNPQVGACVVFYGIHPNVKPDLANLEAPVLGIFAERDGFVTPETARELERQLNALGKSAEVHIYPDVDHAFFNDHRPDVYNNAAAIESWNRVLQFFSSHL